MRRRSDNRGLSMVEMMFAIWILSVVLLGLLGVLDSILRNQTAGRSYDKVNVAANYVFGRAGQALAQNFDEPLVPKVFAKGRQAVPNLPGVTFELWETKVHTDLQRVDIVIYWSDKHDVEHHVTMSTKFVRGG